MKIPNSELRGIIYSRFKTEAECARTLGWSKQKLNRMTNGKSLPDVNEVNQLAVTLNEDVMNLFNIFLRNRSTNE